MSVACDQVKVVDDLPLIPNMIPGGNDVDIEFEQLFGEGGRDAEAGGSVLAICDDQIDVSVAHDPGQAVLYNRPPRTSKNVADEENAHELLVNFDGNREWATWDNHLSLP